MLESAAQGENATSLQWEFELKTALPAEDFHRDPFPALSFLQAMGKHGAFAEQIITAIKAEEDISLADPRSVGRAMFTVLAEMGHMPSHPGEAFLPGLGKELQAHATKHYPAQVP